MLKRKWKSRSNDGIDKRSHEMQLDTPCNNAEPPSNGGWLLYRQASIIFASISEMH